MKTKVQRFEKLIFWHNYVQQVHSKVNAFSTPVFLQEKNVISLFEDNKLIKSYKQFHEKTAEVKYIKI